MPDPDDAQCSKFTLTKKNAETLLETLGATKSLDIIGKAFGINNQSFGNSKPLMRILANQTYEFNVNFFPHPFHHHINPYQIQQNLSFGFMAQKGEWRDVVSNNESFTARVRTLDFTGKVVMHCHFLPHEDRGLMGYYEITTNATPCTSTKGTHLSAIPNTECKDPRSSELCPGSNLFEFEVDLNETYLNESSPTTSPTPSPTPTSNDGLRNIISNFYFWFSAIILYCFF